MSARASLVATATLVALLTHATPAQVPPQSAPGGPGIGMGGPGIGMGGPGIGNGPPVEIVARDGIEWDRENMRYTARGAAKVTQGDKTIEADVLTAFYRQPPGGGTQIFRYTAAGAVRLTTPTQRAVADNAVYDLDSGVVVLTGKAMKITTPDQEISARDSLEYWDQKQLAVARGNAVVASSDGRRIGADTLAAYFEPTGAGGQRPGDARRNSAAAPGSSPAAGSATTTRPTGAARSPLPDASGGDQKLDRVEAFGNVIVTTPTEIAQGEKAVYSAKTETALLTGNVKLTRGRNQANGDFLELNLGNGLYKLGCKPGTGSSCVRGLFVPDRQGEGSPRQ